MADNHYEVDETLKPARDLMDALRAMRSALDKFDDVRDQIIQQKDNAASGNAVYAKVATRYGYAGANSDAQQAAAAGSFGEIDSAYGNAYAALNQMLDRHI